MTWKSPAISSLSQCISYSVATSTRISPLKCLLGWIDNGYFPSTTCELAQIFPIQKTISDSSLHSQTKGNFWDELGKLDLRMSKFKMNFPICCRCHQEYHKDPFQDLPYIAISPLTPRDRHQHYPIRRWPICLQVKLSPQQDPQSNTIILLLLFGGYFTY